MNEFVRWDTVWSPELWLDYAVWGGGIPCHVFWSELLLAGSVSVSTLEQTSDRFGNLRFVIRSYMVGCNRLSIPRCSLSVTTEDNKTARTGLRSLWVWEGPVVPENGIVDVRRLEYMREGIL
jgi:hypothetical protein